jgi:hypothetical protein
MVFFFADRSDDTFGMGRVSDWKGGQEINIK